MSRIAFPFATLSAAAISATPWEVSSGSTTPVASRSVEAWDYAVDIGLRREFRLDPGAVREQLGIQSDDAEFDLVVTLGTGSGSIPRTRRPAWRRRLELAGDPVEISLRAPGDTLSGRLQIVTTLVLARPAKQRNAISPSSIGARLWSDVQDLALEGDTSRFPMEAVSFRSQFPGQGRDEALWLLHWQPSSLQADFLGAVRLYLNTDQAEFLERFRTGEPLIMRMVLAGIMSEMSSTILAMDDAADVLMTADPASVAGRVAAWLRLAFPGVGIATVREKLRSRPGEFQAAIQSAARADA